MEVAAVSLSSWEHEILGRIAKELSGSDPKLTSLVTGFNRLAATEEMPSRSRVAIVRRDRRSGGYRRKKRQTVKSSWFLMTLWFVTTAALIAVALVLNLFGPGRGVGKGCAQPHAASCTDNGLGALSVLSPRSGS
jgi:hypothetical protein